MGSPDYVKLFEAYGYPGGQVLSTCNRECVEDTIETGWKLAAEHGCSVIVVQQDPLVHPIMHKLKNRETLPGFAEESLLPSIQTKYWEDNESQIKLWLDGLSKVEVSESYWFDKGGILTTPLAPVVQQLFESLSINANGIPLQFFGNSEARTSFDADFKATFQHALSPKVLSEEVMVKGTSNEHPLKIQFLACPPNFKFKLHSHPNVELCIPFIGELGEKRLIGAHLNPSVLTRQTNLSVSDDAQFYGAPSDEEMRSVKNTLQQTMNEKILSLGETGEFVDRSLGKGEVLFNDVGTVHQSYTSDVGCLLLVMWSGLHADLENCACYEALFMPSPK